jgi:hypothetical protein
MPAHRQAAAGFDEEDGDIVLRIMRRVKDAAAHHIMTAGFKHQPLSDPVEFAEKVLTFLTHVATLEHRAAAGNKPYGVSAGMGVDAKKGFLRHGYSLATVL